MDIPELKEKTKRLIECGSYNNALALLVMHGEETPSNAETCILGIVALEKLNRLGDALSRAENWCNSGQPLNPYILRIAGFLMDSLGRPDEALSYLSRSQRLLQAPDAKATAKMQEIIARHGSKAAPQEAATAPVIREANPTTRPQRELPPVSAKSKVKLPAIFSDWSDAVACLVWLIHLGLIAIFVINPYWKGNITHHPTWQFLEMGFHQVSNIKFPIHMLWIIGIILIVVISGMVARHQAYKGMPNETIEFDSTRRVWSYHVEWSAFLLSIAASLYLLNDSNVRNYIEGNYRNILANALGIIAVVLGGYCLWLFLPGSRPRVQLVRTAGHKGNRLVIARGVLLPTAKAYLPQDLTDTQVGRSVWWLLTFTGRIHVTLDSGEKINLIAPCSLINISKLSSSINTAINDAKIIGSHKGTVSNTEHLYYGN